MTIHFNFLKKKANLSGLCCLYLLPDQFILTRLTRKQNDTPTIMFIERCSYQSHSLKFLLETMLKKHGALHATISWILYFDDYQLLLLDPPAVEPHEMIGALRWQIKELINFPAEDAAIQYFAVPSRLAIKQKIYVAAASTPVLQKTVTLIQDIGLDLKSIDIPELALRNINALYGDDQCYLGLLVIHRDHALLIVTYQKNLLLSRQLNLPGMLNLDEWAAVAQMATPALWLNNLLAEIQNSFTFCQSQQQQDLPTKMLVSTPITALPLYLGRLLHMTVEPLHIEEKLNFECALPADEYLSLDYLIAIGGALRECEHDARN